jgi:hypothetical protein
VSFLSALRLPHYLAIGAIVAIVAVGAPSKWFGLVSSQVSQVERLRACMEKHGSDLASLVTTLGEPQQILAKTPAQRRRAVRVAERRHELQGRQGAAIEACARTVAG